jgi:hypothetical protein
MISIAFPLNESLGIALEEHGFTVFIAEKVKPCKRCGPDHLVSTTMLVADNVSIGNLMVLHTVLLQMFPSGKIVADPLPNISELFNELMSLVPETAKALPEVKGGIGHDIPFDIIVGPARPHLN